MFALARTRLCRSDDRDANWRVVIANDFSNFAPMGGNFGISGNKMDRSPFAPWAFVFKTYKYDPNDTRKGSGQFVL